MIFAPSSIAFLLCYFVLRYLKLYWEQQRLPSWSRLPLGILAWGTILSLLGMIAGTIMLTITAMTQLSLMAFVLLIALGLGVGVIAKYANANPELFDYHSMKPFIKDSLAFADPGRRRASITEDLDRHEVRRVYKEMTGKDLSTGDNESESRLKREIEASSGWGWRSDGVVRPGKALQNELAQTIASPHLHLELETLKQGETTDFTDSWKINTLKKSFHGFFSLVTSARIVLPDRRLVLTIEAQEFTQKRLEDPKSLYRLKQELYEFFQGSFEVGWMKPYLAYVDVLECTCIQLEEDVFAGIARTPLLTVSIPLTTLKAYANRYFNAGEMQTTILLPPADV